MRETVAIRYKRITGREYAPPPIASKAGESREAMCSHALADEIFSLVIEHDFIPHPPKRSRRQPRYWEWDLNA